MPLTLSTSYRYSLGMGLRTSGMRISTRLWYRLLSQSRLQRSTGSYLHSSTRQDLGRRFSDSSWLPAHTEKVSALPTWWGMFLVGSERSHSQRGVSGLALAEPPEGLPESFHQGELQVDHHVEYSLREP